MTHTRLYVAAARLRVFPTDCPVGLRLRLADVAAARPLLIIFVLLLIGCDHGASKPVELKFWAMGREGEVVAELVRDFESENPDIRVRVQQLPWTSAHEKLLTAFAGDALPDLCQLGNTWIPEFHAIGAIEDLTSRVRNSTTIDRTDYFQGIWDPNVINDRTFGVPWYVDACRFLSERHPGGQGCR